MRKLILISALLFSFNGWAENPQLLISDEPIIDEENYSTDYQAKSIANFFFFKDKGAIHIIASQTGRDLHMNLRGVSYNTANSMANNGDLSDAYIQLEKAIEEATYEIQLKYSKIFEQKILEQFSDVEINQFYEDLPKDELRKESDYSDVDYDERLWSLYLEITLPPQDFLDDSTFMDLETMENKEGYSIEFSTAIISNQDKFEEIFESALKEYEDFFTSKSGNAKPAATPCRFIKSICYERESKKPFTGTYSDYQENGQLSGTGKLVNGKQEGVWKYFRYNGQIDHSWTFKNGVKHGIYEEFYANGQLQTRSAWIEGRKEGYFEGFYESGQIKSGGKLKNGKEEGVWHLFHENGRLDRKSNFKNGKTEGLGELFYENGQLQSRGNNKDGKKDGIWESFYDNGNLEQRANFKNGKQEGLGESFYDNGNLLERANYKNGKQEDLREVFYDNGNLQQRGNYKNSKRDGTWETLFENGQLERRENYKDGEKVGPWDDYHENGQLRSKGNYKDGNKDGLWEEFDVDGNLIYTELYKDGVFVFEE